MNYNYVEEKVDTSMIDRLELKYPGVKGKISKASRHSKRMAIASILGNREIFELIKKTLDLQKSDEYLTNLDELVVLFRKYVEVADVEKKTLGEVMTPITLVEQMLDTLPSEVWSNPNLKWLDPCAGVGTFPSIVVQRLMKGLKKVIPNPEKRYGHIIENMIYVCELQDKNLFVFNCVFDLGDSNATNSYCGSFLDENFDKHMTNIWGVEKFDIIIGNPPYQQFFNDTNKKSIPLWDKFVQKSLNILIDGGYLNMVHPDGWRRIDGDLKSIGDLLKSKQMIYLEIHSVSDGIKTFGVQTTYDFYCVKNKPNNNFITEIKCIDGKIENIDISKLNFFPNGMFSEFEKLIAKDGEEKVDILYSSSDYGNYKKTQMSKELTNEFIYPCVYLTYGDGSIKFWYSSTNKKGHFGIPKIIWSNGGATKPIIDTNGEYGVMNFACSIVDEPENLKLIQTAMLSEKFLELMSYSDGVTCGNSGRAGSRYNKKAISTFRKDFYKQFLND
jgi:hypothetical protein